jgi:predicted TIM-barrel fold metal-dependent hydrolase
VNNWSLRRAMLLAWSLLFTCCLLFHASTVTSQTKQPAHVEEGLRAFANIRPIDVHVHVFKSDVAFQAMLQRLNLKLMNILVVDDTLSYRKQLEPQITDALALVRSSDGHVAFCTTFDPYKFNEATFDADSIKQLDRDFVHGAVAVKIWKNVGMEIKTSDGKFIMPDDPKFEPIYKDIARHHKTLMTHLAEPDVAWGPPDPSDPSWSYYQENPQWFLYNKPGVPSKQQILQARDHVLAENPNLRMVGVHLGSMEKDLDNIAVHLNRYPNFAIDTAARMEYLMITPPERVRAFLIKYQDRVLYGTDLDLIATANVGETLTEWESTYARDWTYLATDQIIEYKGKKIRGLKLPEPVLQKIFHDNALHWIPGLASTAPSLQ